MKIFLIALSGLVGLAWYFPKPVLKKAPSRLVGGGFFMLELSRYEIAIH